MACVITALPSHPTPTATPVPPTTHKTIVFCNDETPSYPPSDFAAAASAFAGWVDGLVQSNQSGASVYVQWIKDNSFADDASYASFVVPPLGPEPTPAPALPTAPVMERDQRNTVTAQTTANVSQYEHDHGVWLASKTQAQNLVKQSTDKIRKMPYNDIAPSDIWGCPQRATLRFDEAPNDIKYLVIASDMDMVGPQEQADVKLSGVHVIVIYFEALDIGTYNAHANYWMTNLKSAGAVSFQFYRPGDILPVEPLN